MTFSRSRNTNSSSLAFGGTTGGPAYYSMQQKNMMAISWTNSNSLNTARIALRRSRNTNSCFSFRWWIYLPTNVETGATEEYDGNKLDNFYQEV
jgi:hypothetical protein